MNAPGGGELIVILLVVLVVTGGRKLPELAASLGQSIREFRRAVEDEDTEPDEPRTSASGADRPAS